MGKPTAEKTHREAGYTGGQPVGYSATALIRVGFAAAIRLVIDCGVRAPVCRQWRKPTKRKTHAKNKHT
jgi:hypothetical protein